MRGRAKFIEMKFCSANFNFHRRASELFVSFSRAFREIALPVAFFEDKTNTKKKIFNVNTYEKQPEVRIRRVDFLDSPRRASSIPAK
jgi:hypothetical protein